MNSTEISSTVTPDECHPTDDQIDQQYNLTLHIISLFVILVVSLLGASISVVSARVKALHISPIIINIGKYFGSGYVNREDQFLFTLFSFHRVVLATGFIHMLPAAMEALTDPCLPEPWHDYEAYAGLFAMLAALAMQLIEFLAHERYRSSTSKLESVTTSVSDQPVQITQNKDQVQITLPSVQVCESHGHQHGVGFQDEAQRHKISTYLLEFGIALHSVLIGVALGTNISEFVALFIALSFHQFFEGMALGAQIARVERMSLASAITMVLFFALTTPIGIAIGIGIHSKTYNPKAVASLLANGILDSISAGILIYVALVNLITAEMGSAASGFHGLKKRLKVLYFIALYLGVAAMAIVGRWA